MAKDAAPVLSSRAVVQVGGWVSERGVWIPPPLSVDFMHRSQTPDGLIRLRLTRQQFRLAGMPPCRRLCFVSFGCRL